MWFRFPVFLLLLSAVALAGCSERTVQRQVDRFDLAVLADWMLDPDLPARLDMPGARMISSFDPTGGNDDANHTLGIDTDGWLVLADLQGAGFVSRFWMTGPPSGSQRIRFFFDGEASPRIDTTLDELCGGTEPFVAPLAGHENHAWYSYVPFPFADGLVIKVEPYEDDGSDRHLYYQLNYHCFRQRPTEVTSFPVNLDDSDRSALRRIRLGLSGVAAEADAWPERKVVVSVPAGSVVDGPTIAGPGILREIQARIVSGAGPGSLGEWQRQEALRDLVVRVYWDGSSEPSVAVPLRDFFGMTDFEVRYRARWFGKEGDHLVNRWPMPFQSEARFEVLNRGTQARDLELLVRAESRSKIPPHLGYFHATWRRTTTGDAGQPHTVVNVAGRGKLVGCLLHVRSNEKSWLILESDEVVVADGLVHDNRWHGTGLEDYFNGGWYYQNPLCRPLHGLLRRAPFRTSQYRIHALDAPTFRTSCRMLFERGPANVTEGTFESAGFLYLNRPKKAGPVGRLHPVSAAADAEAADTVMMDLLGLERMDDWNGALACLEAAIDRWPDHKYVDLLRLRREGYRARNLGFDAVRQSVQEIAESATSDEARDQARLLRRFYDEPGIALLGLYCSTPTTAYVDGHAAGLGGNAEAMLTFPVELEPGSHALCLEAKDRAQPRWVQVGLAVQDQIVGSNPDWRWQRQPVGTGWRDPEFIDTGWPQVGGLGSSGPPVEPFVTLRPNGFVGLQSASVGIWVPGPEGKAQGPFAFRTSFQVPAEYPGSAP